MKKNSIPTSRKEKHVICAIDVGEGEEEEDREERRGEE